MLGYNNVGSTAVKNDVSMDEQPRLCSVRITRLTEKDIQRFCGAPNAPTPPNVVDTHVETPYRTRFSVNPKPKHQSRLPHNVSLNVSYDLGNSDNSDEEKSPIAKRRKNTRPKCEPSSACIKADTFTTNPPQPYHYEYQPGTLKQHQITRLTR